MVHQIVLLKWADTASVQEREQACRALRELSIEVGPLRSLRLVTDQTNEPDNFDVAVMTAFDSERDWRAYQQHPAHLKAIQSTVAPILVAKSTLRYST